MKLTPEIIEEEDEKNVQIAADMSITDENKQALKNYCFENIVTATANFIMMQIFIEGLKNWL
jgi:hypothetical protein